MDNVLESVGEFGLYQKGMLLLIGTLSALASMCIYATVFVAAESQFTCRPTNQTQQLLFNYSTSSSSTLDTCQIWSNITSGELNSSDYSCAFDDTYYGETIITEWSLICDRQFLTSMTQTSHMIGSLISLFSGYFGDRYGRRRCTLIFMFLLTFTLILTETLLTEKLLHLNIMTRYFIYTTSQFIIGMLVNCCYCTAYVLLLELTSGKYRTLVSNIYSYIYVIGELVVMIGYYITRDWHMLNWIIVSYAIISFILLIFFLPESPQWLITVKRNEDAYKILHRIAVVNKKKPQFLREYNEVMSKFSLISNIIATEASQDQDSDEVNESNSKTLFQENENINEKTEKFIEKIGQFVKLFWPKETLIKTILLIYIWNAMMLGYYGVSLGITSVNIIDPYLMYFLSCIAEIIGCAICHLNDILGRKITFSGFLILSTVMSFLVAIIPHDYDLSTTKFSFQDILVVISALIAKAMLSGAYNIIYIYTSELYNTSVRTTAIVFLICIGGIGSFIAPQINLLRILVFQQFPYIVYAATTLLSVICVLFLPETKDKITL